MNRKMNLPLICFLFVVLTSHAFAEVNLADLVKEIQSSIVTVITYDKKGKFAGQGSGFFIDRKGHIITNYHVLQGSHSAEIKTYDGKIYPVKSVLAENEKMDLIKLSVGIREASFKWLAVKSTLPAIAERIVVIGSPMGLEQTVSEGIVSGVREIPNRGKVLQISAPISPGSSCSPVVNMKGQVVGVATFYLVKGQNLNFAIPSRYLIDLKPSKITKTIAEWTFGVDQKTVSKKRRKDRLFVQTEPEGAKIRILNIKPKFYQGIILKPGRYHVEVSADGYEMEKVWIKVESGKDKNLKISLKKLPQLLTKDPKIQWVKALMTGSFDVMSKQDRARIAEGLFNKVSALKAYLPSLTPDQKRWLEAERSSLYSVKGDAFRSKLSALERSIEFQLDNFNGGLDQILEALICVFNKDNSLNQELLCWAYANLALTDSGIYNYAIYWLNYRKVVDFSPNIGIQFHLFVDSDDNPWRMYHRYGRAIQEHLVLPLILKGGK